MNECYMNTFYESYSDRRRSISPRESFVRYYQDLYVSENYRGICATSFRSGGQYDFLELARPLLDYHQESEGLANTDLIIFITASDEFNPIHSYGHALINEYTIQCRVIDVVDRGAVSVFIAIEVACAYLKDIGVDRALLLFLEQSTIPRAANDKTIIPIVSGGFSFLIDSVSQSNKKTVILSQLVSAEVCQASIGQFIRQCSQTKMKVTLLCNDKFSLIRNIFVQQSWENIIEVINVSTVAEIFKRILTHNNSVNSSVMIAVEKCQYSPEYGLLILGDREQMS